MAKISVLEREALGGGILRITFQMDPGSLSQEKLMRAIELIGMRVAPALREELDRDESKKGVQQHI